jgi:hypothetical protein
MSYMGARNDFQSAVSYSGSDNEHAIRKLADGGRKLSKTTEDDIAQLKREIAVLRNELNALRSRVR